MPEATVAPETRAPRRRWLSFLRTSRNGGPMDVTGERLVSLDAFRGLVMFLLIAEGAHVYQALSAAAPEGSLLAAVATQFHHHPWHGLRFWDLIQPYFMFIVGVAMAFSLNKRWSRGESWTDTFRHIAKRCAILLALGVTLHIGYRGALVWELWNVLAQLSFTIMVAFLLFRLPVRTQLAVSLALLGLTELAYRAFPLDGFDQPFVQGRNFGAWMDLVLMGKINPSGWVAINAVPTAAHTIWGVLAGKLLMSRRPDADKIKVLAAAGLAALAVGYGLDAAGITPIIKRICTTSFILASGGWCLVTLAFFYWLVDVRGVSRWATAFIIVGMNPIFIYMFTETIGKQWLNGFAGIFTGGVLGALGTPEAAAHLVGALVVLGVLWYLCYWLYRRRIFIKI